jgi:hypothetical protein
MRARYTHNADARDRWFSPPVIRLAQLPPERRTAAATCSAVTIKVGKGTRRCHVPEQAGIRLPFLTVEHPYAYCRTNERGRINQLPRHDSVHPEHEAPINRGSTQSPIASRLHLRKVYRDVTAQAVVVQQRPLEYRRPETGSHVDGFGTLGGRAPRILVETSAQPQHKTLPTIGPKPHLGRKTHRLKRTQHSIVVWS